MTGFRSMPNQFFEIIFPFELFSCLFLRKNSKLDRLILISIAALLYLTLGIGGLRKNNQIQENVD